MEAPRTNPMAALEPTVRSTEEDDHLRHPTPDLQSLQGAYIGNIERLEDQAERMSTSGSELGEEIRKLHLEQKLADSRGNSLVSTPAEPIPITRSRNVSTSSYANSIVDLNNSARWGGYSPGGYVTSPVGSLRSVPSASWSQHSLKRQRSTSRSTRLDQVISPQEEEDEASGGHAVQNHIPRLISPKPRSQRSRLSMEKPHEDGDQRRQSDYFLSLPQEEKEMRQESMQLGDRPQSQHSQQIHQFDGSGQYDGPDERHMERPGTACSGDTFQQARVLFHDFDGVHYSPINENFPQDQPGVPAQRPSSMMPVPPPRDSMVYYPAPVPRMLNLPKRLSQLPSASVQAKRRTHMLSGLPADARKSALWLAGDRGSISESQEEVDMNAHGPESPPNRRTTDFNKRATFANLPPQLRASMFFDHQSVPHEVQIQGDSAADTLDSILEASARAPVSAFVDHPFAGHLGSEVYGRDFSARRNTVSLAETQRMSARKSRSSMNLGGLFGGRESQGPDQMNKLRKRNSTMSLGAQLEASKTSNDITREDHEDSNSHSSNSNGERHSLIEREEGLDEAEASKAEEMAQPQYYGPPTTLLAELQLRKQQQKTRNRAAATAFPNGMHATLLELDAVAQIEQKKRKGQRVALAWEDPAIKQNEEEEMDEDVPLGMLFPGKNGLINRKLGGLGGMDRPIGLIEQRELEDNEPLSKRRNRLMGVDVNRRPSPRQPESGVPIPPEQSPTAPDEKEDENEGETLAQRIRRLKNQKALDGALGDVTERPFSDAFASEMLSQFGTAEEKNEKAGGDSKENAEDNEEETLGQRRARLQREALTRGESSQTLPQTVHNRQSSFGIPEGQRPELKQSRSLADLLSAHPAGQANNASKVSNDALVNALPAGSLLQQNEATQARHKAELLSNNKRSSSYGLNRPLVDMGAKDNDWDTPLGLLGQSQANAGKDWDTPLGLIGKVNSKATHRVNLAPNMGHAHTMPSPMSNAMPGMQMPMQMPNMMGQNPMMMQQMGMYQQPNMALSGMQMPVGVLGMGGGMNNFGNNMYQQPNMAMSGMNMGMPMQMPMGNMGMGMGGVPMTYAANAQMQMQMGMNMNDPSMDPRQRDLIDRWRQSIV